MIKKIDTTRFFACEPMLASISILPTSFLNIFSGRMPEFPGPFTIPAPCNRLAGSSGASGSSRGIHREISSMPAMGSRSAIIPISARMSGSYRPIMTLSITAGSWRPIPIRIGAFAGSAWELFVLEEVELGDFTIVGAGAVVTTSFKEGYAVIAGNPAKIVKQLDKLACEQFRRSKYPG